MREKTGKMNLSAKHLLFFSPAWNWGLFHKPLLLSASLPQHESST